MILQRLGLVGTDSIAPVRDNDPNSFANGVHVPIFWS